MNPWNAELLFDRAAETPLSCSALARTLAEAVTEHEAAKVTWDKKSARDRQETISPATTCFGIPGASGNWH
jgi:hypothetical protein